MSYTKGPWKLDTTSDAGNWHVRDADGNSLMCDEHYYPWVPDNIEDWHLIAAAPEMYEALVAIKKELQLSGNWDARDYGWPDNRKLIDAALARAEGKVTP
jgi:hypothetical protein